MVEYLGTYYKNINDYLRGFLFETDITNYLNTKLIETRNLFAGNMTKQPAFVGKEWRIAEDLDKMRKRKQAATTKVVNYLLANQSVTEYPDWWQDAFALYGVTKEDIVSRMKSAEYTPAQRQIIQTNLLNKQFVVEAWQEKYPQGLEEGR